MAKKPTQTRSRQRSRGGDASISRIESYDDTIPEDGVERFMHNRDMISLEGNDAASDDEDYLTGQQDEVFGLNLPEDDDEDEDAYDQDEEVEPAPKKERKKKTKAEGAKGRFAKTSSDEEDDDEDEDSDEEEAGWGRAYHARPSTRRGRQEEEEDDEQREEDRLMEEQEVKRLQRKMRESVKGDDDWGLEDMAEPVVEEDLSVDGLSAKPTSTITTAPAASLPSSTPAPALLAHLQSTDPVKLALARDLPLVVAKLRNTERGMAKLRELQEKGEGELHEGLGWLHYQTLLTYTTTLAYYLHLATLPASSRPDLSTHPILARLLQLKEGFSMLEDLDFDAASDQEGDLIELYDGEEESDEEDDDEDEDEEEALKNAKKQMIGRLVDGSGQIIWDDGVKLDDDEDDEDAWVGDGTLEDGELEGLMQDAEGGMSEGDDDSEDFDESDEEEAPVSKKGKGKAKAASGSKAPAYAVLEEPEFVSSKAFKKSASKAAASADLDSDSDDLGESTHLSSADAADKSAKKRSLRFHTSRIAATSARREAGRQRAMGGDDDLPYKDKKAARDAALRRSTGQALEENGGLDVDDLDFGGEEDELPKVKKGKRGRDEEDEAEAYYESVKRQKKEEKQRSKEVYDEGVAAEKLAREVEDTADGPRSLTRAISKNRGLTPKRSKASRNPRVKQKERYEKAKRKIGSQRAVYKGGQGALGGSYSGEKSGISQASKSRRF